MIIIEKHVEVYGNITKMSQMITDSELFKFKIKIIGETSADGSTKDVENLYH